MPLGNQTSLEWDVRRSYNLQSDQPASAPPGRSLTVAPTTTWRSQTDANGNQTVFSRDALDNLGQVKDASGGVTQYSYATPTCGCMTDNELTGFVDVAGSQPQGITTTQNQRLTADRGRNRQYNNVRI